MRYIIPSMRRTRSISLVKFSESLLTDYHTCQRSEEKIKMYCENGTIVKDTVESRIGTKYIDVI